MENERKITAMGMAAGQARLLSITARMSDNELRAQIINNDKMRLATESSQVSDHYVQALNEAELMFANYDENNNASFKQLTFNALTAYNPYNNQYALTNASGNILLSETDYKNYERTKDKGLDEFLKCYGLEKTTTFFDEDNLTMYVDPTTGQPTKFVAFTNPYVVDDENTKNINEMTNMSTCLTPEQLYLAYLGNEDYKKLKGLTDDQFIDMNGVSVVPKGYDAVLNSEKYNEYFRYLDKYNQKWDQFMKSLYPIMDRTLDEIVKNVTKKTGYIGFDNMSSLIEKINKYDNKADLRKIMQSLIEIVDGDGSTKGARNSSYAYQTTEVQEFYDSIVQNLRDNMYGDVVNTNKVKQDASGETSYRGEFKYKISNDPSGNPTNVVMYNEDGSEAATKPFSGNSCNINQTMTVDDGNGGTININVDVSITYDPVKKEYTIKEILKDQNSVDNMKKFAKSAAKSIRNSLANCWNPMSSTFTSQEPAKTYYNEWDKAADELGKCMYGPNYSGNPPKIELGDPYVLYRAMTEQYTDPDRDPLKLDGPNGNAYVDGNGDPLYPSYGPGYPNFDDEFYQVYLNIILDKVQDTYGEPYFTWIDTSAPNASYNENGEAKAKWYENIWNMCQKNGYRVLKDGLASSTEWIQYAFESGIVNMQQVDTNGYWNPLIYTNCSDITSQTSDKKIAQAEAEYNAAMNKIENKDKRYDLELKNIDTEHNSLQTEYDSIKSAMDEHIKRVFKLYS